MIAMLTGVLAEREGETIVVQTDGGVGYAVAVSLGTADRLPAAGGRVTLYTELVVKEDGWSLYGFDRTGERLVFQRLLTASGFGPKLALAMLSMLGPERTVRSIQQKDLLTLSSVSGVGKKKAERLVLELQDKFKDVVVETGGPRTPGGDEAVRALVGLGYPPAAADDAVRAALASFTGGDGAADTPQLIRRALQQLAASRGGR
ncbi:MAG TPA: Holliday junction branch migration protein RuvA [Gemmatimonadales bacterium]|nr:Holliday junction branch migration protein RuvA [Gemmatimonadales bacterium]